MATRNTALAPTMEKVCPAWITKPTLETAPMVARIVVLAIPSHGRWRGALKPRGGALRRRAVARLQTCPWGAAAAGLAETAAISTPAQAC